MMDFFRCRARSSEHPSSYELCHTLCSVWTFADLLEATEGFRSVPMAAAALAPAASMEPPRPLVLVYMTDNCMIMRTSMTASYLSDHIGACPYL